MNQQQIFIIRNLNTNYSRVEKLFPALKVITAPHTKPLYFKFNKLHACKKARKCKHELIQEFSIMKEQTLQIFSFFV